MSRVQVARPIFDRPGSMCLYPCTLNDFILLIYHPLSYLSIVQAMYPITVPIIDRGLVLDTSS